MKDGRFEVGDVCVMSDEYATGIADKRFVVTGRSECGKYAIGKSKPIPDNHYIADNHLRLVPPAPAPVEMVGPFPKGSVVRYTGDQPGCRGYKIRVENAHGVLIRGPLVAQGELDPREWPIGKMTTGLIASLVLDAPEAQDKPENPIREKLRGMPTPPRAPVAAPPFTTVYLMAFLREAVGPEARLTDVIQRRHDMDGVYLYCRRCGTDIARGEGRTRVDLAHALGCDAAVALGQRALSW